MSDYKKYELIKLNFKQIYSEMAFRKKKKRSIRLDKLVQGIPIENLGYEALTPKEKIKNGEEYINALYWGIKNKNVKNIALAGPYGSGKSSIIQSYLTRYPSSKTLNISLAAFDLQEKEGQDGQAGKNFEEKDIETGIFKQLFYKVDSDKIPQSRYRKIKKKYYKKYFAVIMGLSIIILLGIAFFLPDTMKDALDTIENSGEYYGIEKVPSYIISVLFGLLGISTISYALKWCTSRFRVKEVKIADAASVSENKDESSIFDKSMDELVYFFETTDYNVVFIEDLDRFNSTKIFVKLRELNTILNNYELIKRRIVFVYAIRDDIFKNEERTKFFDFIIPVIPIINRTNSGEVFRDKLMVKEQSDGTQKSSLFNISSSYINLISPFVEDMRVLTNICNEFIIYKNTLKGVNLNDEEMFSMMIFKSLYPKEFSDLEAEKGIVKQALKDKKAFIESKQMEIDTKRVELEHILNSIEKDIFNSIRDVKAAFLNYLVGAKVPFHYCYINGNNYYYESIMQENFDMKIFRKEKKITIYNYDRESICIDNMGSNQYIQDYLTRIDYLENSEETRQNEIRNQIVECNKRVAELHTYSLKKLIEIYGSKEVFSKEVLENKFLTFLLRKGYINENYADYINYFHPNSITNEEMNFIRGIRMQEACGDYSYTIKNVKQVCERIETYEFKQIEALNYDLVDYLITCKKESEQCKELFVGLAERGEKSNPFIRRYIERKKNTDVFVNVLCKRYQTFWNEVVNDELLTEDKKFEYLALILEYADLDDILTQNDMSYTHVEGEELEKEEELVGYARFGINNFIENDTQALKKLSSVPINKMIDIITELKIYFREIDVQGVNKDVIEFIFENNYYELNAQMLHSLFVVYFPDKIEQLNTENYTVICNAAFKPLMDRLHDVDKFKKYVSELVVGQDSNVKESIHSVEGILERLFDIDLELCKKVLNQQKIIWDDITDCCKCSDEKRDERKCIWDYILENGQVLVSWNNFMSYYNEYNLTQELVNWIDKNMAELVRQDIIEQISDEIIKEIITENISIHSLDELTMAYGIDEFDICLSKIDSTRIAILVKNQYIPYSNEYLNEMYQVAPTCVPDYLICNKEVFLQNISKVEVENDTVVELLRSRCFEKEEINELLKLVSIEDMDHNLASEIQKLEMRVPKEYAEKAWELLEEEKRYQLLLNQIENYSIGEISSKFATLAPVYKNLADLSKKHREHLPMDEYGYNEKLLGKLKDMGYLSSVKIDEYYEKDNVSQKDLKKQQFEVWVKKQ